MFDEGMPNAVLEVMGAGAVVIATSVAGIADVVDDPDNGVLLEGADADRIAEAMIKVLEDEDYCDRVRRVNVEKAWENFESHVVTMRLEDIYKNVVEGA